MEKSHSEILQSLSELLDRKRVGAKDKHESWLARIEQNRVEKERARLKPPKPRKRKRRGKRGKRGTSSMHKSRNDEILAGLKEKFGADIQQAALRANTDPATEQYPDKPRTPDNPSREALARVRDRLPVPTICRYCGGRVERAHHSEVYGREYGDWPWLYRCTQCDARVGMHRHTDIPLGTLANLATREARNASKQEFKQMQKELHMPTHHAYYALAEKLDIDRGSCHFGWFDIDMCVAASRAVYEIREAAGLTGFTASAPKKSNPNEGERDLPLLFEGQRQKGRKKAP